MCVCVCMHACVLSRVWLLSVTSWAPLTGIFQARILEWVAISYTRSSSWPRDRTHISCTTYMGRQILYHCATWESCVYVCVCVCVCVCACMCACVVFSMQFYPMQRFVQLLQWSRYRTVLSLQKDSLKHTPLHTPSYPLSLTFSTNVCFLWSYRFENI